MKDYENRASSCLSQSPAPRLHERGRLVIGGMAFALAFMLAFGAGLVLSLSTGTTRTEALASRGTSSFQMLAVSHGTPGGQQWTGTTGSYNNGYHSTPTVNSHGSCNAMTVSSVEGSTIVLHSSCNKTVTVHTTSSTQYEQDGRHVSVSDIHAGTHVYVTGHRNSDGSITASRIVID